MRIDFLTLAVFGLILSVGSLQAAEPGLRPDEQRVMAVFAAAFEAHLAPVAAAAPAANSPVQGVPLSETDSEASRRAVAAARARRRVMARLVREDPETALAQALDRGRRARAQPAVQEQLEDEVSAQGRFEVMVSRPLDLTTPAEVRRRAVVGGRSYEVNTFGRALRETSSASRSLHGVVVDGVLALSPDRLRRLRSGETPAAGKTVAESRCPVSGKVAGADQEPADNDPDLYVESGTTVYPLCSGGHISSLETQIAAAEAPQASAWTTGPK